MSTISVRYGTPAESKKKAGGDTPGPAPEQAVLVWTNPSPTATFNGKDVTLSETIASGTTPTVKGLRIIYSRDNNANSARYTVEYRFQSDLTDFMWANYNGLFSISFRTSNYTASRTMGIVDDDTVHFGANYRSNSTTAQNTQTIPQEIYVIK